MRKSQSPKADPQKHHSYCEQFQAQPTSGTWFARDDGTNAQIISPEAGDYAIALIYSGGGTSRDKKGQANARLIAAAPDLLEACRQMIGLDLREGTSERLQRRSDETHGDGITEEGAWYLDAIVNAREAIAKAEGQS